MSIVTAYDVAYVRFGVPDLAPMHRFLTDFGLIEAASDDRRLFMRGYEGTPFAHVTELAEAPAFLGFGIWLRDDADLHRLAAHDNATVEPLEGPGGGSVVRLVDPDGFVVEAVAGQAAAEALARPQHQSWNQGGTYPRQSAARTVAKGHSHVRRLGHVVLGVSSFRASEAWYKERFGFITSDEIQPAPGVAIGAFMRADRGDEPCDHHTLFLLERGGPPGFMHAAYEVADLDDLMAGHDHLLAGGYDHQWGVGRHHLGSQVFDYWRDPYGNEIEHWTDGDQFATRDGGGIASIEALMGVQWGMPMPPLPGAPA
ncbi:VOC family protein [Sphingomonas sp. RB3P16]|uniref:VOC family protein n=1 Tax=Parasphingomonas frigoris TaxID=3096163 RepID=UPI002FCBD568